MAVLFGARLLWYRDVIDLIAFLAFVLMFGWRLRVLRRLRNPGAVRETNP